MTTPIDEEEVGVPLRLQPVVAQPDGWRGRSSSLVAAGLIGFIAIGIALGTAFDDGGPSNPAVAAASLAPISSSAPPSRRTTPTRTPRLPPLPALHVIGGQIPTEQRLVYASGLQVLDLATGTLASPPRPWGDFLMPLGNDELVCACIVRGPFTLRFGRFNLTGAPIVERDLLTFDGVVPVPEMTEGYNVTAALDAELRHLFVLVVIRRPPVWTVELHQVDVATGELVGSTVLESLPVDLDEPTPSASARPGGGPPDGVYAWANTLAASPDGGSIFASVSYSEVRGENWTNGNLEWMVPLVDGTPGAPKPLSPAARQDPDSWCLGRPTFVDPELLVQVCTPPQPQAPLNPYYVRRLTTSGESLGDLPIPGQQVERQPVAAMIDGVRRVVVVWDPQRHTLTRVGIDDGQVEVSEVAESMLPDDERPHSQGYVGADPGLVASPDGRRLYALGLGRGSSDAGSSTGVWVFDAEELSLLDHWRPLAFLTSLAVAADGRFVYAAGATGFDVEGNENPWPASITVYDAESGEIQVVYGAVARDTWISFPTWP